MEDKSSKSDKELFEQARNNNSAAFDLLKQRYLGVISTTFKKHISKGGLHKELSFNYQDLIPDIESIVWSQVFKKCDDEFDWGSDNSVGGLIRIITERRTLDMMRKSIRRRQQGVTDNNLEFPSYYEVEETEHDVLPINTSTPETINSDLNLLEEISNELTDKQNEILKLQEAGLSKKKIAEELNISDKTVYNALQSIKQVAESLDA
jgi:RNA polymerase sigma factor (sigma-70 family)